MTSAHVDTFVRDRLPPPERQPEFLFDLPELQYPEQLNAAVELMAGGDPDTPAVINDAGSWTFAEIDDLSDRIARLLVEEEGLVPGNRVFLRGPNSTMLFASWLGVLKAGGVRRHDHADAAPRRDRDDPERAQVSHAIVDSRFIGDFRQGADAAGTMRSLLRYDGDHGEGELETRLERSRPASRPWKPIATMCR